MTKQEKKIYSEAWAEQFNLKELCEAKFEKGITHDELLIMEGENSLWMVECSFAYSIEVQSDGERVPFLERYTYKVKLYNDESKIKTYEH